MQIGSRGADPARPPRSAPGASHRGPTDTVSLTCPQKFCAFRLRFVAPAVRRRPRSLPASWRHRTSTTWCSAISGSPIPGLSPRRSRLFGRWPASRIVPTEPRPGGLPGRAGLTSARAPPTLPPPAEAEFHPGEATVLARTRRRVLGLLWAWQGCAATSPGAQRGSSRGTTNIWL